eukprot:9468466-Pyramimonas_sp.AAC.1
MGLWQRSRQSRSWWLSRFSPPLKPGKGGVGVDPKTNDTAPPTALHVALRPIGRRSVHHAKAHARSPGIRKPRGAAGGVVSFVFWSEEKGGGGGGKTRPGSEDGLKTSALARRPPRTCHKPKTHAARHFLKLP